MRAKILGYLVSYYCSLLASSDMGPPCSTKGYPKIGCSEKMAPKIKIGLYPGY